ncbi:hypothetical protein A3A75_01700 [Candidatus Woesebacteria bacterium RIFCSPLOWO2_01_FULL_39_10]|uniref:Aminotransferase class III n=2 Tax=Candidatus Woeseibacteriota TaxID=1752722 RepID=A0A1F8B9T0_9BACT|nr:MAG: hypothetical protein A3A75_01700 [Candidatus Woesebacteria bacterium RIFCSPLOWO2_01_FULL_39_10]
MIKNNIIYNSASDWSFNLKKAKGSYIWTTTDKKILDFTSGWNVTNLGWNNSEINKALIDQVRKNVYAPMETADSMQNDLAEKLTNSLPPSLTAVGRTTGGVESNEEAIKTARAFTKRSKILGFHHGYHGQSISMLSAVLEENEMKEIGPQISSVVRMEYPAVFRSKLSEEELLREFGEKLEKILKYEDIAAILSEPGIITGWGSTYVAPKGFTTLVRQLTKKYGTLLILDEVGTGFSRCGELYGMHIEDIVPDVVTFAKGFSNGAAAIGAMVTTSEIADKTWQVTNLQSTFGWTPVACAAALKNLQIHLRDKVWEKSKKDGEYMKKVLTKELWNLDNVGDVRGYGMEIGICFVDNKDKRTPDENLAKKVVSDAFQKGLYILYGSDGNIQLMPPLIINRKDLDKGLEILINTVKKINTS